MDERAVERLGRLRGRGGTYAALIAPVVGLLVLGLLLPFLLGDPVGGGSAALRASNDFGVLGDGEDEFTTSTTAGGTATTVAANTGAAPGRPSTGAGTGTGSNAEVGTGVSPTGEALTASDVGVTPEDIRVAVLVPNLGGFAGAGFAVDLGDSRASFGAFFDDVNDRGGINGRRIAASYIDFDPLNDSSMRAACLEATEDQKVFATFNVNGFYGPGILCVSEEHGTPLVQAYYSDPDEWYARSNGLYITAFPSKDRALRNLVHEMHARGTLKGKTIGIVDSDYPFDKSASEKTLIPTLRSLGYEIAHRATLSSDTATQQSQIPLEVQRMQSAGVDTIFFAVYFVLVTTWVQQASNRQYFPQYLQSDFANGTSDGGTAQMPSSYHGTIGVTSTRGGEHRLGLPMDPEAQACTDRWNALTGTPLEPQSGDEAIMLGACGSVDTFAAATRSAGANLTRIRMRDGFTALGEVRFPLMAPFTWSPGKTDGGDQVRLVQWHFEFRGEECRCWVPVDEFHPARS